MKLWNFENSIARNLEAGGVNAGGEAAAGGGSAPASGGAPAPGAPAANAAAAPPANLMEAASRLAQPEVKQADGQQPNGQQAAPNGTAYVPEGLPENLRGATDKETIDKLAAEIGKLPKAPASAKDYDFKPPAEFAAKFGDMKDDPVMPIYREIAHKHGLSNAQFQSLVVDLHAGMDKAGLIPEAPNFEADVLALAPKGADPKTGAAKAMERINNLANLVKGLETRGQISKAEAADLAVMWSSATAVKAFEKIAALIPGEHGLQSGGQGGQSGYGWDQAELEMADERYSSTSPKYDPAFRKQADERMKSLQPRGRFRMS